MTAPRTKDAVTRRLEIVATVLLAIATVATAWSSYQANRWNAQQARFASRANALRIDAARAESRASSLTEVDIATFIQWVDATAHDDTELAEFYAARFRPEFRPAFDAWIATTPLQNPDAPRSPFAMDEYRLADQQLTEELDTQAAAAAEGALRSVQRSTNYVLCVVLFAVALFFGGVSTHVKTPSIRRGILLLGALIFLGTVAWVATFPVNFSV